MSTTRRMPTLRRATADAAALITAQRHQMFADNHFATEDRLCQMDANFEPWVRERLADGRYIGLLLEDDNQVVASAGILLMDFPPHYMDVQPLRAYLLNFYTAPEARGLGYAKQLVRASVAICRDRGIGVVTLHASPFGRPIYEQYGFKSSNEMMLRLEP